MYFLLCLCTATLAQGKFEAALSRRPYRLSDSHGELLVRTAPSEKGQAITLSLGSKELLRAESTGEFSEHSFELGELPTEADLTVRVGDESEVTVHLSRTDPPTGGSFVQVDYLRRGLLVGGNPFIILGMYTGDSDEKHQGSGDNKTVPLDEESVKREIAHVAEAGFTSMMYYRFYMFPLATQQALLDECASRGIYFMYPLHVLMRRLAKEPEEAEAVKAEATSVVERFRGHPGLLGWYVCDDCASTFVDKARNPGDTYSWLKKLDPAHVVIGADWDLKRFGSMLASRIVDVMMFENYVHRPDENAHMGTPEDPGADGNLRQFPLRFEALVNCPGPYQLTPHHDKHPLPEAVRAEVIYAESWLSVVIARVPHQLYFRRKFVSEPALVRMGAYAREVRACSRFLDAGLDPEPVSMPKDFRAGILRDESGCGLLVVVHLKNQAGRFSAEVSGPVRPVADGCRAGAVVADGHLEGELGPFGAARYLVGPCGTRREGLLLREAATLAEAVRYAGTVRTD